MTLSSPTSSPSTPAPARAEESSSSVDVLVVGGGINGVGIARDLAGRGWRVLLVEQDDLAAHTSSASTKLIHGGLRYLEHGEFLLVRKALQEREVLLRSAPHLMGPLRFVMPHDAGLRPVWLIRLGLLLYDHLAHREVLPASGQVDLRGHPLGAPLQERFTQGFVYSDGWVDDARLVVLNALDAQARGARVLTRTRCSAAQRGASGWTATLSPADGAPFQVQARVLVNAAGPWVERFLRESVQMADPQVLTTRHLRLVQGSHIVVRRTAFPGWRHDHAYLLQGADRRIVFAIPYEQDHVLIGTTDGEWHGDPADVRIRDDEVSYLCEQVNRCFRQAISPADVVWSYSGVRPLLDDDANNPSAVTRDYVLEARTDGAPLLTVWGGKLTTYRRLAEEAADLIGPMLGGGPADRAWTHSAHLPGGDFSGWIGPAERPDLDFERFLAALHARRPWLPVALARRLARAYGARVDPILGGALALKDLGFEVAPGLHEAELRYLCDEEWAVTGDDVLWRRSKLGLHVTEAQRAAVGAWMAARRR